jgi:pimeloyl-ACP methyl ester carboxylesterase
LTCPEFVAARLAAFSKRSDDDTANAQIAAALARCHDRLIREGIDPAQYNFETAARDVLDLMWVLHIKQANLVAFQHIGVEALAILRLAPAAVRSLTLDNPAPPGETQFTDPIGDLAGAFHRFDALCNADHSCATSYSDLPRDLRDGYQRLQAKPALVSEPNPFNDRAPKIQVLLDGPRSADALADALRDTTTYRAIPSAIRSADDSLLGPIVVQEDRLTNDAPWGAQASYICAYDMHTEDPTGQKIAAQTLPEFVAGHDTHWATWCKGWNVPDLTPSLGADIVTDTPVLAFRGDLTPDGNPEWLPKLQRGFSAMTTIVFPTLGSDLLANGPPCLSAIRRAFLLDPTANLDKSAADCAHNSPQITFITPTG